MGNHRTSNTQKGTKIPIPGAQACLRPCSPDRNTIRPENRYWLGISTERNVLWIGHDLLAQTSRLAKGRSMGQGTPNFAQQFTQGRQNRFLASSSRFGICPCSFWGQKTGPNPTDRRKNGSKHHVISDANGVPLAAIVTGANRHDVTQLLALVESIPPIAGKRGRPRKRPDIVQGDRGYDSQPHRLALRFMNIIPLLAKRRTDNGSGLGKTRWVIERTLAWLHQFRRLRIRYERRSDIHEAFLTIGCAIICWNQLNSFC